MKHRQSIHIVDCGVCSDEYWHSDLDSGEAICIYCEQWVKICERLFQRCSQCGQMLFAFSCGPTHAILKNEAGYLPENPHAQI